MDGTGAARGAHAWLWARAATPRIDVGRPSASHCTREESVHSMALLERYRAAVERNEFSVFLFWRGLW